MNNPAPSYHGYRFPADIIAHAIWLYFRFSLSFRDVEDLLAQRGITVTYETIRQWCRTFGHAYARRLRQRRGPLGDTWHLDELFVSLNGRQQYLWRAVDEDGDLLDILVQSRRNRRAAVRFFRKLLKKQGRLPRRADHRQATQLPGGPSHRDAVRRALHGSIREQPRRGFSSTDAPARTPDARLQIDRPPPTLRLGPRRGAESLSGWPTSAAGRASPFTAHAGLRRMGAGDVCLLIRMTGVTLSSPHTPRHALGGHPEVSALEWGSWLMSTFRCAASVAARSWISQIQVPGKPGSPISSGSAWNAAATFGRRIPSRKRPILSFGPTAGGNATLATRPEASRFQVLAGIVDGLRLHPSRSTAVMRVCHPPP